MNTGEEEVSTGIDGHREEITNVIPSSGEKDNSQNTALKKKLLYEAGADCVCEFGNGESIKVSKTLLAYYSPVFNKIFFGESPVSTIKIEDFDCETFRTFLDCLFGFKEYTVLDALLVYPIAHKYEVNKSLKNCVNVLIPDKMNENVCLTLNLATFYQDEELENEITSFLELKVGFFNLLDSENYRNLLEPLAISHIIQEVEMDSLFWKMIFQWGDFYLKKQNKPHSTIRLLFKENNILSQLSLKNFESASSILDFDNFSNNELLDCREVLNFLKDNIIENKTLPEDSLWVKVKNGDKIVENVRFLKPIRIAKNGGVQSRVSTNKIYFNKSVDVLCHMKLIYKWTSTYLSSASFSSSDSFLKMQEKPTPQRNQKEFHYGYNEKAVDDEYDALGVEIMYEFLSEFLSDCTILKTSLNRKFVSGELCFTKNFEWELVRKN